MATDGRPAEPVASAVAPPQLWPAGTIWLTGLPAAGKTTLADAVADRLRAEGHRSFRLDGDELRRGLCADLGFDEDSRHENLRRAAHLAVLLAASELIVVVSLISPYRADRALARQLHEDAGLPFVEVFVDTPLSECERRDPRGLYARARRGELTGMTGLDAPYELPDEPDARIYSTRETVAESAEQVMQLLAAHQVLPPVVAD